MKTLNSSLYEAEAKVHHLQKCKQELAQRLERYQERVHQLDQHINELGKKHKKQVVTEIQQDKNHDLADKI